jgi:hypothetical protein
MANIYKQTGNTYTYGVYLIQTNELGLLLLSSSAPDPDPNPDPDPHVFGPPGSRFVSQRSGSFYYQAKIERKTLIPNVFFFFFWTFYL